MSCLGHGVAVSASEIWGCYKSEKYDAVVHDGPKQAPNSKVALD